MRCRRQPATSCQVNVFQLRNLCPCVGRIKSKSFTVGFGLQECLLSPGALLHVSPEK